MSTRKTESVVRSVVRSPFLKVAMIALFLVASLFAGARIAPPQTRQMTYLVSAGDVSRGFITSSRRSPTRVSWPIQPHHMTFTSSNGPVEIFLVKTAPWDTDGMVEAMLTNTDLIRAGQTPPKLAARATGVSGTIPLRGWWPYGSSRDIAFMTSAEETEVTLTVYYSP